MSESIYPFESFCPFCGDKLAGDMRPHGCPGASALCLAGRHAWGVVRVPAAGPRTFKCGRCLTERLEPMPDIWSISPAVRDRMDRER